jgi:hypothetical protein
MILKNNLRHQNILKILVKKRLDLIEKKLIVKKIIKKVLDQKHKKEHTITNQLGKPN